jgi:hypothetical protein
MRSSLPSSIQCWTVYGQELLPQYYFQFIFWQQNLCTVKSIQLLDYQRSFILLLFPLLLIQYIYIYYSVSFLLFISYSGEHFRKIMKNKLLIIFSFAIFKRREKQETCDGFHVSKLQTIAELCRLEILKSHITVWSSDTCKALTT